MRGREGEWESELVSQYNRLCVRLIYLIITLLKLLSLHIFLLSGILRRLMLFDVIAVVVCLNIYTNFLLLLLFSSVWVFIHFAVVACFGWVKTVRFLCTWIFSHDFRYEMEFSAENIHSVPSGFFSSSFHHIFASLQCCCCVFFCFVLLLFHSGSFIKSRYKW